MGTMFTRGLKSRCERIAVERRQALGLAPHAPLAPRDLARSLGIRIYDPTALAGLSGNALSVLLEDDQSSWSALTIRMGEQAAIVLNSTHSSGRQASDLMHEMSHLILGHQPSEFGMSHEGLAFLDGYEKEQEDEADWLAGCLLLPRPALIKIRSTKMDEETATRTYLTSRQMLRYRISVTGVDYQISGKRLRGKTG